MYGIQIAFRDYKPSRGFMGSEWVGWYWFERLFTAPTFKRMISNTLLLNFWGLLWSFPVPIILALAINQLRFKRYKRVVQTVLYAPHFISIMVVCGMIRIFLSPSGGLINLLLGTTTAEAVISIGDDSASVEELLAVLDETAMNLIRHGIISFIPIDMILIPIRKVVFID